MKFFRLSLLLASFACASAISAEAPVAKSDMPVSKKEHSKDLVCVDLSKIIDPADPNKSQSTEWKERMNAFQESLEKEQKPLQELQTKLQAKQAELEAKTKKGEKLSNEEQSSIMGMFQELQSKTQQLQAKAEAQFTRIRDEFREKIAEAADIVAPGSKPAYKEFFVSTKNVPDITNDVIAELNKKHQAEKRAKKMAAEAPAKKAHA